MIDNSVDVYSTTVDPQVILGYRKDGRPIHPIAGGSGEITVESGTDDDDDDDKSDTEDDDDDEVKPDEGWTPPTKEEFDSLLAKKAKADSQAAERKRLLRAAGLDIRSGKPVKPVLDLDDDEDDEDDTKDNAPDKDAKDKKSPSPKALQRQLEREAAKAEQRGLAKGTALITAIPEALKVEGWNGKNMPRMLRLLDIDAIEIDEDGEVEGLDDQIKELKTEFPEFFKRTRMKESVKDTDVADMKTIGADKKEAPKDQGEGDWTKTLLKGILGG